MVQQGQGQMLVAMSPDELKSFLISSGMGDALTYFERSQVDIVELINKATIAIDPEFRSAPPNIIQAIAQQTSSQVLLLVVQFAIWQQPPLSLEALSLCLIK
jgi:hypothetical protein